MPKCSCGNEIAFDIMCQFCLDYLNEAIENHMSICDDPECVANNHFVESVSNYEDDSEGA